MKKFCFKTFSVIFSVLMLFESFCVLAENTGKRKSRSEFVDGFNSSLTDGSVIMYLRYEPYAKQVFSIYVPQPSESPTLAASIRQLVSTLEYLDEN